MSYRVDPTIDLVQSPRFERTVHCSVRVTQLFELAMGNHAVLYSRQPRHRPMRSHFFPHTGHKCDIEGGSPPGNICSPG